MSSTPTASRPTFRWIDVTYGGQFSVDGGDWIDIPGTATVEGTPFSLRVAEAHAQLVTR